MFGITSAKLEVGMTIDKINKSNASENVKKKQIELFNKYNTTPDDKIDEKEFAQYEKDCTKQKWKTAGIAIAGTVLVGGLLYLGYKNLNGNNFQEKWKNIKNLFTRTKDAAQVPVASVHGEYNSIAMVGDKATVVRADLVQANPTFAPHASSAIPPKDLSAIAKGAEGPGLSASYVSKAESLPIQEIRTQAYYDEIIEDIYKAGGKKSYFNPRTGNITTVKLGSGATLSTNPQGKPIIVGGFPSDVTVSDKNGRQLLRMFNRIDGGYVRQTRAVADGYPLCHLNSNEDLWHNVAKTWVTDKGRGFVEAPAYRTPVQITI